MRLHTTDIEKMKIHKAITGRRESQYERNFLVGTVVNMKNIFRKM